MDELIETIIMALVVLGGLMIIIPILHKSCNNDDDEVLDVTESSIIDIASVTESSIIDIASVTESSVTECSVSDSISVSMTESSKITKV